MPAFEPLFADSDCSAMSNTWRGSLESLAWFMRYWRDNFSAAYDLNRVFLIGSDNLCMANFGLRDMPVERDTALKALHERINKYRMHHKMIAAVTSTGSAKVRALASGIFTR
ncbi:two-component system sensor kinase [Escherichia coli]|uniref:Two-component system sensor kinase n=1 Tax=Escherichia coli TaxID=562 RepID=A0A485JCM1_ECOLX|nr:two-component system sensor kinase [Escherichia coli]